MAESTFVLPTDIDAALKERAEVWSDYDGAVAALRNLEQITGRFGETRDAGPAQPLTAGNQPAQELQADLAAVQAELAAITDAEMQIQAHQAEIAQHRKTRTTLIVIAAILVIVIILFLLSRG